MTITYTEEQYVPPTPERLGEIAVMYIKQSGEYRELKLSGTLQETRQDRIQACTRHANNLIDTGTDPEMAWNRAIRACLLFSESD